MSESDYSNKRKKIKLNLSSAAYAAKVILGTANKPSADWVIGLDPSHYSKIINWKIAYANGIRFAFIKAIDGVDVVEFFPENYRGALDAGVLVGAYSWLYPEPVEKIEDQAVAFARLLKGFPVQLPPAVDFEWTWPKNPEATDLLFYGQDFLGITNLSKMVAYTCPGYWGEFGWAEQLIFADLFYSWQGQYGVTVPDRMKPWLRWDWWQFTDKAKAQDYGFPRYGETECTLNRWRGTLDELKAICIDAVPAPQEPPAEPPIVVNTQQPPMEPLFDGAARIRHSEFAGAKYHMVEADLDRFDIEFRVGAMTTPAYLVKSGVQIAINGLDGWYPDRKKGSVLAGRVASRGLEWVGRDEEGVLYISKSNQFSLKRQVPLWNACAFPNLLVLDGQVQPIRKSVADIRARTAFGVSKDRTKAYMVVVDGDDRERGGAGMNVQALALLMESYCDLAVMGDSGGSTTMAIEGLGIVGNPTGENKVVIGGAEWHLRAVMVNTGLRLRT